MPALVVEPWVITLVAVDEMPTHRVVSGKRQHIDLSVFRAMGGGRGVKSLEVGLPRNACFDELKIDGGRNFYALRHTFETIAGGSCDQVAVDALQGHAPDSDDMSAVYREAIEDKRLQAVANHVRRWFLKKGK